MPAGVPVLRGRLVADVKGGKGVTGVELTDHTHIACDAVAMSGGWSPIVNLACHRGAKPQWDETIARPSCRPMWGLLSSSRARPRAACCCPNASPMAPQGRNAARARSTGGSEMPRRGLSPSAPLWWVKESHGQGLHRLPERCDRQGPAARRARGLSRHRAGQALHDHRHGDRPGQARQCQCHRHSGRGDGPQHGRGRHHHLPSLLHAGFLRRAGGPVHRPSLPAGAQDAAA